VPQFRKRLRLIGIIAGRDIPGPESASTHSCSRSKELEEGWLVEFSGVNAESSPGEWRSPVPLSVGRATSSPVSSRSPRRIPPSFGPRLKGWSILQSPGRQTGGIWPVELLINVRNIPLWTTRCSPLLPNQQYRRFTNSSKIISVNSSLLNLSYV
jgi:hypothetical protein